jgi:DNA-binding PadR family transcriptional regulator
MFRDNSLIPTEAVRLAALGLLAEGARRYGDLAAEIRHFISCVAGPSLELLGTSLELLRHEGLVAAEAGAGDNATLEITAAGRAALAALLRARLRAPTGDVNRLALMLKLRFLALLPEGEQRAEIAHIAESLGSELARLYDLRRSQGAAPAPFRDWLDHDIAALEARLEAITEPVPPQ